MVEIVFVLVIIGIIATMVTNPGLLRQKDSVTSQKNSNLLSSFIDQRKLDMFLGKKLGDMYVETLEIRIQPDLAQELLLLTYTLAPSRSSDSFDGFLPSDNNLTYFLHSQDFRCTIREQHDLKVVLVCGFQEHIAYFISMDMITCSKDGSDSSPLS